ncbi:long-chain-fatty-acid--CoA ligase [Piscibacillus salipiscarius]|uniref:Long-chain fatty acid--CoA ligase n=1 Tax=Piscibacillus salipiscarius TaxID=299480 RepID=A0ABW5QDU0_9BACI|nr:long-chain fatty acid--CoA ligase [Piscibacillus salipiscarius]
MSVKPWHKFIPEGNPKEIQIPELSLGDLFLETVNKYPRHTAITFMGKTFDYQTVYAYAKQVAAYFQDVGIKKGDQIALMLPNCPQYVFSYFGAMFAGATVVQVNPMYKEQELMHVLKDSEAAAIIAYEPLMPIVNNVLPDTSVEHSYSVSFTNPSDYEQLIQHQLEYQPVHIQPKEDVAVLQYTGGTTGRSKGAMLTHYNIVANTLQSAATAESQINKGEERVLVISPLFHVYGMTSGMCLTFRMGGNLILLPRFEVEETVKTMQELQPTSFPGVPTMFIAILNYAREHNIDLGFLETVTSGSAPLSADVLTNFEETTGASIAEGYGLSEASPVTHRNPVEGVQKAGSIGIPIPNTDSKVVDLDTGTEELPIGEVGELVIKGPQIMKGYWNMPDETAQTVRDGWLYTGDLAKMDEDGFFYIVGRKKEMIIASGFNIYPIEIETVLYQNPKVLEAAVIGIPDPYRGETIKAVVSLKEGQSATEEEIINFCKERLSNFKVPTSVDFIEEFPKTAVGKILKRELKDQYISN